MFQVLRRSLYYTLYCPDSAVRWSVQGWSWGLWSEVFKRGSGRASDSSCSLWRMRLPSNEIEQLEGGRDIAFSSIHVYSREGESTPETSLVIGQEKLVPIPEYIVGCPGFKYKPKTSVLWGVRCSITIVYCSGSCEGGPLDVVWTIPWAVTLPHSCHSGHMILGGSHMTVTWPICSHL